MPGSNTVIKRKFVYWSFLVADLIVLAVTFELTSGILSPGAYSLPSLYELLDIQLQLQDVILLGAVSFTWQLMFRQFGLYQRRNLLQSSYPRSRTFDLIKATGIGTILVSSMLFLAGSVPISIEYILVFWGLSLVGTFITREVMLFGVRQLRIRGRNLRYILIVGTNNRALKFARSIHVDPEMGYRLRGFVDDGWYHDENKKDEAYADIVCSLDEFDEYLRDNIIDEVLITLPLASFYTEASRIVKICEEFGVVVNFFSGVDFLNDGSYKAMFGTLYGENVITILPPSMSGWQLVAKRVMDVAVSSLLLVIFAPLLLSVALAIKITSPGPILFIQERVGLNKRKFKLLKFRTMVVDAEEQLKKLEHLNEVDGAAFKITNDPRITPIGNFLRRSSLDELPQLVNVFLGDMSLVGPRPLPLRDFDGFDKDWHRRRFSVRPGITCYWQIGGRSSISFDKWMELDMEYIDSWSFWLDLKILLLTIPAVLKQRGAV